MVCSKYKPETVLYEKISESFEFRYGQEMSDIFSYRTVSGIYRTQNAAIEFHCWFNWESQITVITGNGLIFKSSPSNVKCKT